MPDARSAKTRARDIDRAQTCSLLDAAYADGQLSAEEHESRTATAMHATTLGALSALTKDLQIPDHLLDAATASEDPAGHPHRRRRGLVVAVTAVVAMIVAALARVLFAGGTDAIGADTASPVSSTSDPNRAEPIDTLTADGMREFLRRFELKFGDLTADDVDLYSKDAVVARMTPRQPTSLQRWMFTGTAGFEPWTPPSIRDQDQETVDLAQLDVDRIGDLIENATSLVRLPSGHIDRVAIRADHSRPGVTEPRVTVYVVDTDVAKGNVTATLAGEVVDVQTA